MTDTSRLPARRTALAYAAWADELLDRLHTLREETTDRELRRLLIDASENASRSWMSARTLAGALASVEDLIAARDAARARP
jgi:hypothetical protein